MHVTILSRSSGGASLHKFGGMNIWTEEKAAKKAVYRARNDMKADLYTKL